MSHNEVIEICPKCHSITSSGQIKPKCYVNTEKGVYHCHQCGASGLWRDEENMHKSTINRPEPELKISPELIEDYQAALETSPDAREWLQTRLLTDPGTLSAEFGIGLCESLSGAKSIVIPSYRDGELVGVKHRALDEDAEMRYWSTPGSNTSGYLIEKVSPTSSLILVEGEFDAISAALLGFPGNVLALSRNRLNNWAKGYIKQAKNVYACMDQDEAGSLGLQEIQKFAPGTREVKLPDGIKDLNEFLQQFDSIETAKSAFNKVVDESKSELEKLTFTFKSKTAVAQDFLSNRHNLVGDSSGIPLLDQMLGGGYRPHELTLYNAPAKTGKTSFMLYVIYQLAKKGKTSGLLSLEMDPAKQLLPSFMSIGLKRNIRKVAVGDLPEIFENLPNTVPEIDNVICFDGYGATEPTRIREWIHHVHSQFGTTHFFLDHAGYSLQDSDSKTENMALAKTLKTLTMELPIHLHVIVQPPKLMYGQKLGKDTLYGTSAYGQAMDQLITLTRGEADNTLEVRLTDARFPLAQPSDRALVLYYNRETCAFTS